MNSTLARTALSAGLWITFVSTAFANDATLKYSDGEADGKRSINGAAEMVQFTLPTDGQKVQAIRIHGSRYGTPDAPDESFLVYFLNDDLSEILHTEMIPYSAFERGAEKWVDLKLRRPIALPKSFWVAVDFRASRTKGVYVSFDTSTGGKHSRVGLPGMLANPTEFRGDWMIEVMLEP